MINHARKKLAGFILLVSVTTNTHAAIPVIDPAALVKFQTQIVKMIEQINLLNSQVTLLQNQLNSELGNTGFSTFLGTTVTDIHSFLPNQLTTGVSGVISTGGGVSGLQELAKRLRTENQSLSANDIYPDTTKDISARASYDRESDQIFSSLAAAQNAYNAAGNRKVYLDRLRESIASAQSPKEREQLALRINVENSLLLNDIQQMLALQMMTEQQQNATRFDERAKIKKARPKVKMDY
jgi:conjugal transfer/entry exclusion protein